MNETRNQILNFRSIEKAKTVEDQTIYKSMFFESYERDLKRKIENLRTEIKECENNLILIETIKKELNIKTFYK